MSNYIILFNGKKLDLDKPDPDVFTPEVIAHSLSRLPRFCGHTKTPWSVAAHTLLVGLGVDLDESVPYALLHDAAEIVTGDIPRPVKKKIDSSELARLEFSVMGAVYEHYGLDFPSRKVDEDVFRSDQRACQQEIDTVLNGSYTDQYVSHRTKWSRLQEMAELFLSHALYRLESGKDLRATAFGRMRWGDE